jgi:hypothetical protein
MCASDANVAQGSSLFSRSDPDSAFGVGANTAIFSVVDALLFKPLPYRQPEQLVKVFHAQPDATLPSNWAYPRFEVLRDENQCFAAVSAFAQQPTT